MFRDAGFELQPRESAKTKLAELRDIYEPFVNGLSRRFIITIPPMIPKKGAVDNWQTSAWTQQTPGIHSLVTNTDRDGHFD